MHDHRPLTYRPWKTALVLSGGGARAAYQVGVLRAIANLLPKDAPNPFQIISGTSAGALNAVALATYAQSMRTGVRSLEYVWGNIKSSQVYKLDSAGLISSASNWVFSFMAARKRNTPVSLLNNAPLTELLESVLRLERIEEYIQAGLLDAISVTTSGYTSGQSVSFFQGRPELNNWQFPKRIGIKTRLDFRHLLASTAIPTLFPAVKINREYFGDGAIRQLSPLSPAIHLGAERILVIGGHASRYHRPLKNDPVLHPSLSQIIGHILNSAFIDTLPGNIATLQRMNRMLAHIPPELRSEEDRNLRHIDLLAILPSQDITEIAATHLAELPKAIRLFTKDAGSSTMLSLLLFEKGFCDELMTLGFTDAMEKASQILDFFSPVPSAADSSGQ